MRVLAVNVGSTSLKLSLVGPGDEPLATTQILPWSGRDDDPELESFVTALPRVDAVGHRVVHGGDHFNTATRLDRAVVETIERLTDLAPLHQTRALAGIHALNRRLPDVPAVACFDTSFHTTLPAAARTYALPAEWRDRWPIHRYGFHGLSHAYTTRRVAALLDRPTRGLRLVSCHLGAGASLCAIRDGQSIDTTMGYTPLEGLVMATRSGSVDPGLVLWLIQHAGLTADEITTGLDQHGGLAGLSRGSGNMRDVLAARAHDDANARLAFDVYLHRLRKEIGALVATLGGIDALAFTGGVGEHQPLVRAGAARGLEHLGIAIDPQANTTAHGDSEIGADGAPVRVLTVTAREDLEIAHQVRNLLGDDSDHPGHPT